MVLVLVVAQSRLPGSLPPRPKLNLDASDDAANPRLPLPLRSALGEEAQKNLVVFLDVSHWILWKNLHGV
jgi:hypothetical protein